MKRFLIVGIFIGLVLLGDRPSEAGKVVIGGTATLEGVGSGTADDDFNRANGALGSDWTQQLGSDLVIVGNEAVTATLSADNFVVWNGSGTFGDNQYSKIKVASLNAAAVIVSVRSTGSAGTTTCYWARKDGIHKFVNNSYTGLISQDITLSDGDTFELRVTGANPCTLQRYVNGVAAGDPTTDSSIDNGGKPGFGFYATGSSGEADDFEGGSL